MQSETFLTSMIMEWPEKLDDGVPLARLVLDRTESAG